VASDAIGMGLNLNIRRIIFNSIFKFNGEVVVRLDHSAVKQISGRAGRYNSPYPNGEVTCRDPRDLSYIRECLLTEIEPVEKAGLLPMPAHIELFSDAIQAYTDGKEQTDLYKILRQFSAMATVKGDFFLCRQTEMRKIAKALKKIPLSIKDAYTMCLSPTTESSLVVLENFARKHSRGQVSGLPSRSVPKKAKSFDDLSYLCGIYSDADLFMWLQFKFPPGHAVEHQAALARKQLTLEHINEALANTDSLKLNHCYIRQATRHRTLWQAEQGTIDIKAGPIVDDGYDEEEEDMDDEERAIY
jgi:ATP-dependent RNA helicase SUPV3L1/SUV3